MAARGWTALLLLAAVFAMHGVQCAGAVGDHTPGHGSAAVTLEPTSQHERGDGGHTAATAGITTAAATVAPVAALFTAGHGSIPEETAGHLWTLCLAVLAAGLAVLLALMLPRALPVLGPARAGLRARVSAGLAPPRPPDLQAICLLRI